MSFIEHLKYDAFYIGIGLLVLGLYEMALYIRNRRR